MTVANYQQVIITGYLLLSIYVCVCVYIYTHIYIHIYTQGADKYLARPGRK